MLTKMIPILLVGVATCFLIQRNNTCFYKGHYYSQDETWIDNCQWKCTCEEADSGWYTCRELCFPWNLSSMFKGCYLNEPKPGKCCKTPTCPPGVDLLYPSGYKEE